ncbi:leucine-rich repeat flightless-interacting protein 1 isoform X8 [Willisornis vidua]|uniref:Leucine-rich repeat flightless-interacting protein 1 isoform X8 n=1 Tax=Willisornis vidua TaxID=1566151 RepID=A0ABQ9DHG7_9PASS|nr:leucine-rich repeat flightless-interacting protein 1 isoform X8 [Willisornis vidua]
MEATADCLSPAAQQQTSSSNLNVTQLVIEIHEDDICSNVNIKMILFLPLSVKAEARLAAKRAARAEAREIRMKELERQQKEKYYGLDTKWGDIEQWMASDDDERMSVGSRGSLRTNGYEEDVYGSSQSRKSSRIEERPEKDFEKDIYELKDQIQDVEGRYMQGLKELKDSLAEVEEKYKKAMVSNAQLDNEKTNLMYQVDTLKDALLELEEQLAESRRQYEEKSKEFEREKHAHSILQFQFLEIKEALKQREEMLAALERQKDFFDSIRSERDDLRDEVVVLKEQLKKHGIVPDSDVATNGETSDILDNEGHLESSRTVPGTTQALKTGGEGMLGKAKEVDMKNEILEDVGKREMMQNTEHEEHKEESEEQEVQTLHAAENTEAEKVVEEHAALSTVMVPESRFAQSLTEHESGSTNPNSDSDTEDLRRVAESTVAQQPESTEAEHHDLSAETDENSEVGALQGHQVSETPQEVLCDSGTEQRLGEAAAKQEEQEDLKTSHALSESEMDEEANSTSESSELVSNQAGLPEGAGAGWLREEGNAESSTPGELQHSERAENKVTNVLEEKLVESTDCTDGRTDKTGEDRAEEKNELGDAVQGQPRETESVGLEGMESCERGVPAEPLEKECGGHEEFIQPVSSGDSPSASSEEQSTQDKTEHENAVAEKDRQEEELMEELENCSGSAERGEQDEASVEAGGSIPEVKGRMLQQEQPDTGVGEEVTAQETSTDSSLLDDKIKESELETGNESGKEKESRTEWVEDSKLEIEVQTVQCNEETAGGTESEKNIPLEGEVEKVVKQEEEEDESKEESSVDVRVTTENKANKETLKENEQELELAHHHGELALEEGANNSLAQEAEQDEKVSEQVKLEDQAEESLEDDGDAFDFDEESNQILESDEKCDGEKTDTQKEKGVGANGAVEKAAHTDKAGEGTDKMDIKDNALPEDKRDEPEETGSLQGEASWKTDEKTDVMEDEIKASDSNTVKKILDENALEQDLESAGITRAESKEDLQGSRKGRDRLKKLVDERESLLDQIKKLKGQLEEKQKNGRTENTQSEDEVLENGTDMHMIDLQRDANRQISDLKFKLAKSEQEITALEQNVIRLEGQVARYKTAAENAERVEDELKAEKRKLQRELRSALDKTEELEVSNGHLVKRLEKMKANRSALLSQQ